MCDGSGKNYIFSPEVRCVRGVAKIMFFFAKLGKTNKIFW